MATSLQRMGIELDIIEIITEDQKDINKLQLTLKNTSDFDLNHFLFDPQQVVDSFMQSHPFFKKVFVYNGLWKPASDSNQIVVMFQKRVKWSGLAQKLSSVNINSQQTKEIKRAFDKVDTDKDGSINKKELKKILKGLGEAFTDEAVDDMVKIADVNGDGKIQFDEFLQAI